MEYSVAIRTLGSAGEKYQMLLDSLNRQTIRPRKILVYIPFGYELPKETIGWEEYVRCPKGMITQRSLPFDEIDTDYILFCDDDISLESTSVQRLYDGLIANNGDCISPNTFPVEKLSTLGKIKKAIAGYAFPRKDDGWAFKIMRNASYTYNIKPSHDVLPTESAAGPCALVRKEAFLSIHFDDERWMEDFRFPLGEDLLFYYKLHIMGYHVFVHYNSGICHLDAGTSSKKLPSDWIRRNVALSFVVPYRIKYKRRNTNFEEKIACFFSFITRFLEQWCFVFFKELITKHNFVLFDFPIGLINGYKYVHSERYKDVPNFDAYVNE